MQNPKVSIIVPIYNVEKYLDRCMQSLLNQTLKDIEIIMVDDGSPDNCPRMCDEYAKKDSRIKVVHKKNAGLGFARNSGLDVATGEYIAFLDSDDYVAPNMYETLIHEIITQKADAVFCGTRLEFKKDHYIINKELSETKIWVGESISDFYLNMIASAPYVKKERLYEMSVWRGLYKKNIIDNNDLSFLSEREYASEDLPFNIDYLRCCKKVILLPNILHTYCLNNVSLTKTYHKEKFYRFVKLYYWLENKTFDVDLSKKHINRFLIGYTRSHIRSLIRSKLSKKEKIHILNNICNAEVWNHVNYKYCYLPIHSALCHYLVLNKHELILYYYILLLSILVNLKNKIKA